MNVGTMFRVLAATAMLAAALSPGAALGQAGPRTVPAPEASADTIESAPWRPLRIAKWTTVAGAAGATVWGFVMSTRADDRFQTLELACNQDAAICRDRRHDGAYRDAELERLYQEVLDFDRKSSIGLITGQIGIAASVVLFLLDLGNERRPADIPFTPAKLEFAPGRRGAIELKVGIR